MNNCVIAGRMAMTPKSKIISVKGKNIFVCYFVVGVIDGIDTFDDKVPWKQTNADFFECFSIEDEGRLISENFAKGSKIIVSGMLKNFRFEDINNTKHFTNVLIANSVEYGDTISSLKRGSTGKKKLDLNLHRDICEMDRVFKEFVDEGYLCLDESDYYYLASELVE